MPPANTDAIEAPLRWRHRVAKFTLVARLDEDPRAVEFARSPAGKVALAAFGAYFASRCEPQHWALIGLAIAGTSFLPARRREILALACMGVVAQRALEPPISPNGLVALVPYPVAFLYCLAARRWSSSPLFTHPVRTLLLAYVACLAALRPIPNLPPGMAWHALLAFGSCLWFTAYAAQPRPAAKQAPLLLEVANFPRVWGTTYVPFPKGQAYLDRFEAKNDTEQARFQLKGLKLLLWAFWIELARLALESHLMPSLVQAFAAPSATENLVASWAHGAPRGWAFSWGTLFVGQFLLLLRYTFGGHAFIGWCRMCGYNVLRNTYKPLYASSLGEFYNRFYFYFKELLADLFFFPTYLRYFKAHPRVRVFMATLAAAGFGNFLFHFLRDIDRLEKHTFFEVLSLEKAHAFYCLVLAVGVAVSNLRSTHRAGAKRAKDAAIPTKGHAPVLAPILVFCFFSWLAVFDTSNALLDFKEYVSFALHLLLPWTTHG